MNSKNKKIIIVLVIIILLLIGLNVLMLTGVIGKKESLDKKESCSTEKIKQKS